MSFLNHLLGILLKQRRSPEMPARAPVPAQVPPEGSSPVPAAPAGDLHQELLRRHNLERCRAGLHSLAINCALHLAADEQAAWMAYSRQLSHVGEHGSSIYERLRGADYTFRRAGENIAAGQGTADRVFYAWMHSPGHRQNILGDVYRDVGFGHACDEHGQDYWVADYGDSLDWPSMHEPVVYESPVFNADARSIT